MAFKHGSKATVRIDQFSGSLVDISAYVSSISFSMPLDTASIDVMGGTYKQSVTGLYGATLSLQGKFDGTLDGYLSALINGTTGGNSISVEYKPQGTGGRVITFEAWMTSYEISTDVGDAGSWSAEFSSTSAVTFA